MIDYQVNIAGNEALLERFIQALQSGSGYTVDPKYPGPLVLETGERFLFEEVVEYFLTSRPFALEAFVDFCELLRRVPSKGFGDYSSPLDRWLKTEIERRYADLTQTRSHRFWQVRPGVTLTESDRDMLRFICYVAISHLKYGPSYASITAREYFDLVTALGSDLVKRLKKNGSGTLPQSLTEHADEDLRATANDAFGTITLKLLNDGEAAYRKAYEFICALLEVDFPRSFAIKFSGKEKHLLPIKGLKKPGAHYLAAGAVRYPTLHPLMQRYADLAMRQYEWLTDLDEENPAMPGTFAVFALALTSEDYFPLLDRYTELLDDEHQSVQAKFLVAFVERYGITVATLSRYLGLALTLQEEDHQKSFAKAFGASAAREMLMAAKDRYDEYGWDLIFTVTFGRQGG